MSATTFGKRRLSLIAIAAGVLTALAPVAQADPGDVFERALKNHQSGPSFVGSPDAIDRAVAAEQAKTVATIDARERSMLSRPDIGSVAAPPDAFERALQNRPTATLSMLAAEHFLANDARQRWDRPVGPVRTVSSTGFDWDTFGVGAGAGIGFILVTLGLGVGVLAVRHRDGRVTNP